MKDIKNPGLTWTTGLAILMMVVDYLDKKWLHIGFVEWMPDALASLQVFAGFVALVVGALAAGWASFASDSAKQKRTNPNTRGANPVKRKSFWRHAL